MHAMHIKNKTTPRSTKTDFENVYIIIPINMNLMNFLCLNTDTIRRIFQLNKTHQEWQKKI